MQRLGAVLTAALITFGGIVALPAAAAGAAENDGSDVSVTRYGGADRYETSLQVAEAVAADAGGSLSSVVLVSGRRWTDAVVAAPVAGALGALVLMTPPDELRADALEFLQRVGVTSALVVGPDASGGGHGPGRGVVAGVLEALGEAGISAERIAGDDRFGTGVAAAARITPGVMGELGRTAVIASGEVFADALVAGPFAARGIHPVLLTPPDELHADVAAYLGEAGISHIVLMGGTAALSGSVEQSVKDLGIDVSRVAGRTRYDTAVKAAELVDGRYSDAAGQTCFDDSTVGLARARVPFDSFSAAPLLGRLCAPLLLADPTEVPPNTAAYLDRARSSSEPVDLYVFGGNAAVGESALDTYLSGKGPDSDAQPEVTSVLPAGTCGGDIADPPTQLVSSASKSPAWSPDCSRIVYSRGGSLWTMHNDGSQQRRFVRQSGGYLHQPVWSPDGTQIAYVRQIDRQTHWESHVWLVDADGSNRTQLTTGAVWDDSPNWSPNGGELAFRRVAADDGGQGDLFRRDGADSYVVVMDLTTKERLALSSGGWWDHSPAWSPDGNRIAYIRGNAVWLMSPDGSNNSLAVAGAFWDGGLSWSPDGTRVAFARGDRSESVIVIADVDGNSERLIAGSQGSDANPRWSPDGQRIAFARSNGDGNARVHVTGARGTRAETASDCRPMGIAGTTAGFPLPSGSAPSTGTLRVAVLFMDFPDAEAGHTTREESEASLTYMETYLERASYGQLELEVVPHHVWLRAEHEHSHFEGFSALGDALSRAASEHAVALADPEFDFSDIDAVMTVFPSDLFDHGNAGGTAMADGTVLNTTRTNTKLLDEPKEPTQWGAVAAHELAHNLGLADLYPYDAELRATPPPVPDHTWISAEWGLMGLEAWFLAADDDARFIPEWRFPSGQRASGEIHAYPEPSEMLAWSRWQLGWLDKSQVRCVDEIETAVTLAPIARPGEAVAMAAVPLNAREVIVIESRRQLGYDLGRDYTAPSGATTTLPNLVAEGVLVYVVDALVASGHRPIMFAGDNGDGRIDDFPVLTRGESVTLRGYTITVTGDNGDTHTVSITRDG